MRHIKPMLATLVKEPFDDPNWIFEIKWDGFRAIAEIQNRKVQLYSRNLLSFNQHFPPIYHSLQKIRKNMVLDGEIVVVDAVGKSHFQLLQNYLNPEALVKVDPKTSRGSLVYYVFDILFFDNKDLRDLPLEQRKQILEKNLPKLSNVKFSHHIRQKGKAFFKIAKKQNLEGIMAKNSQSIYYSGKRTREWLKIKIHQQQEAVIGGFTEPRGSRKKLGALVLGVYQRGKLVYIGHTGGGFNEESLNFIYGKLKPLKQSQSPFANPPKTNTPVTWVKPKIVCEVTFSEWTADGHMRQPIFLGLRPDKKSSEVRKELPQ